MKIFSVIPVKSRSIRLPDKNIRSFPGGSLWELATVLSLNAGITPIVTSDSNLVLTKAKLLGALVVLRPTGLSNQTAPMEPVIQHAIDFLEIRDSTDLILLQPTSPLRTPQSLKGFIADWQSRKNSIDTLISVTEDFGDYWWGESGSVFRLRDQISDLGNSRDSQTRKPLLRENGLYYLTSAKNIRDGNLLSSGKVGLFVTPPEEDLDINTENEFNYGAFIITRRQ